MVKNKAWFLAGQFEVQYGCFGRVSDGNSGIGLAPGIQGGLRLENNLWLTYDFQVFFATGGSRSIPI